MSNLIGLSGNIIGKEDVKHISPLVTLKALDREISRRQLSKDFTKSTKFMKSNSRLHVFVTIYFAVHLFTHHSSLLLHDQVKSNTLGNTKDAGNSVDNNDVGINRKEKPLINNTAPEDSLKALSNSINIRRSMLELNDKLCAHETGIFLLTHSLTHSLICLLVLIRWGEQENGCVK